jgi:hypothetical protein
LHIVHVRKAAGSCSLKKSVAVGLSNPSVIIDLPQMIIEMSKQENQQMLSNHCLSANLLRIFFLKVISSKLFKRVNHDGPGGINFFNEFMTGDISELKFGFPVSDISRIAQNSANEMLKIAYQVQTQIPSTIDYAFPHLPDGFIARIEVDFFFQFIKVSFKERD